MVEKEKVHLAIIYKQNGKLWLETTSEVNNFELYGFLRSYVDYIKELLIDDFEEFDND